MPDRLESWKLRVERLKAEVYALYLAIHDPRVPWYARVFAACVVGYAFSPIDLIPDFIPVIGYLDDLLIVPLGIMLVLKLIPAQVMVECRDKAKTRMEQKNPTNWVAGLIILAIWLVLIAWVVVALIEVFIK